MPDFIIRQGQTIRISLGAYHVIAINLDYAWLRKLEFDRKTWSYKKVGKIVKMGLEALKDAKLDKGIA